MKYFCNFKIQAERKTMYFQMTIKIKFKQKEVGNLLKIQWRKTLIPFIISSRQYSRRKMIFSWMAMQIKFLKSFFYLKILFTEK